MKKFFFFVDVVAACLPLHEKLLCGNILHNKLISRNVADEKLFSYVCLLPHLAILSKQTRRRSDEIP